jgi:hypothetical protein
LLLTICGVVALSESHNLAGIVMTGNAPGTNHPLRRRARAAEKRLAELASKIAQEEGISIDEAKERAREVMRDNPRGDYRAG